MLQQQLIMSVKKKSSYEIQICPIKRHTRVKEYFVIDIVILNFMISVNSKHGLYFAPNHPYYIS